MKSDKITTMKKPVFKLLSFLPSLLLLFLIFGFSAQDGESSGSLSFRISLFIAELISPILPTSLPGDILFFEELESAVLPELLSPEPTYNDILYARAEAIHLLVRKAAHMTEYFLLALSLQLPLASWLAHKVGWKTRLVTGFLLTVCFAALDEYHQTFVPGRSGNLIDVGIDSIGAIAASLLLFIFFSFRQKRRTA